MNSCYVWRVTFWCVTCGVKRATGRCLGCCFGGAWGALTVSCAEMSLTGSIPPSKFCCRLSFKPTFGHAASGRRARTAANKPAQTWECVLGWPAHMLTTRIIRPTGTLEKPFLAAFFDRHSPRYPKIQKKIRGRPGRGSVSIEPR